MDQNNSIQNRFRAKNEATGLRVVGQYIQEFWECGWQPLDQRNDKGIDGIIFMRLKGQDLGVRVNVQVKCGAKYISSETKSEIRICIDDYFGLISHIEYWQKQLEPAILIFVNPCKRMHDKNGNPCKDDNGKPVWIENRLESKAWWVDLKDKNLIPDDAKTLIRIPKTNVFGEHSKGSFLNLIRPLLSTACLPKISPDQNSRKLLYSTILKTDARNFYKDWKTSFCKAINDNIRISRTGWRHIVLRRRGKERRANSFRLLGIAKQMIESIENYYLLNQKETIFELEQKIGLRALVQEKSHGDQVVQVILLRRMSKETKKNKWWFYSVHYRR